MPADRWALTAYPRDVSERVIQSLLDSSESYCIVRVPEPEPEESEEDEAGQEEAWDPSGEPDEGPGDDIETIGQ